MATSNSRARQFARLQEAVPKDFDPEEDGPVHRSDDESDSEESDDGLAGTEHYATVGKSKLRKPDEVLLGPEYSGSRVSRKALLDEIDEDEQGVDDVASDSEEEDETEDAKYADPEDLEFDVDDEDGDIDSVNAFGESDTQKFESFTFRGISEPKAPNERSKRLTAADFMSDSEDEGAPLNRNESEAEGTDEDILDVDAQHAEQDESQDDDSIKQAGLEGFAYRMEMDKDSKSEEGSDDEENSAEEAESDEDAESGDNGGSENEDDEKAQRAELRKIMSEEQKSVVATISQAAKADADKGNAVKQQRKAFDSFLSVRMVLQKALVAANSMATIEEKKPEDSRNQPYEAAEEAAIKLWNMLESMRHELSKSPGTKTGEKRKRHVDSSTPSSTIWERMQSTEVSMIDNRQATLEKWSSKIRGSTSLPLSRKLNPTAPQQSITSLLQDQLASSEHLIKRTKIPRSCAPIQRDQKLTEDPNIYDDGNFYQLLLKELVDQRRVESLTTPAAGVDVGKTWVAIKEAKTKKVIDTKASKGRKLRFTVHEKLQNFMAPEDRATWEPERIDRFFGTLLGQKMTLGEDDVESEEDEENGVPLEEEGLMLFRS